MLSVGPAKVRHGQLLYLLLASVCATPAYTSEVSICSANHARAFGSFRERLDEVPELPEAFQELPDVIRVLSDVTGLSESFRELSDNVRELAGDVSGRVNRRCAIVVALFGQV